MRYSVSLLLVGGALAVGAVASAQGYDTRTMAAPNAPLSRFHSFHLLPTPRARSGAHRSGAYDPMVSSSIANRALRAAVGCELEGLGYHDVEWTPDFVVAIYAATREPLDLTAWDYAYDRSPSWWSMSELDQSPTMYPQGTVIVDVVNPETLDVLWRGSATIALDHDPLVNAKELTNAAAAIIDRFPRATPIAVAAKR